MNTKNLFCNKTLEIIIVFSLVGIVALIVFSQLQTSKQTIEIKTNKELQLDSRNVQNDYRNLTIDLLENISKQMVNNTDKIEGIEIQLITNNT